jgi:hypothetical protein
MKLNRKYSALLLLLLSQNTFALDDLFIGYESDRQDLFTSSSSIYSDTVTTSRDPVTASALAFGFNFNFDFTYDTNDFFSDASLGSTRTTLLNSAGDFFEGIIQDQFTAIESSGSNSFTAAFNSPGTGQSVTLNNFSVASNTFTVYVGARNLGGSTLGRAGPGGYGISGTQSFLDNAITRGQGDGTQASVRGESAYDFSTWGGQLAFNNTSNWYYDPDVSDSATPGLSSGQSDFYSVALHELGHILGLGTADSWNNLASTGAFIGLNTIAANGGTAPDLTGTGSHFAEGTQGTVDGQPQEVAMDPSITTGTQKKFTNVDIAALQDIGYSVSAN